MRLTSILNCLSALTLADALYWKDAGQVPLSECLTRSLVGYVGVFLWRCCLPHFLSLVACLVSLPHCISLWRLGRSGD